MTKAIIADSKNRRHSATIHDVSSDTMTVSLDALPVVGSPIRHKLRKIDGEWRDEGGGTVSVWKPAPTGPVVQHPERLELVDEQIMGDTLVLTYATHDDGPEQIEDERTLVAYYRILDRNKRGELVCSGPTATQIEMLGNGLGWALTDIDAAHLPDELEAGQIATELTGGVEGYLCP